MLYCCNIFYNFAPKVKELSFGTAAAAWEYNEKYSAYWKRR